MAGGKKEKDQGEADYYYNERNQPAGYIRSRCGLEKYLLLRKAESAYLQRANRRPRRCRCLSSLYRINQVFASAIRSRAKSRSMRPAPGIPVNAVRLVDARCKNDTGSASLGSYRICLSRAQPVRAGHRTCMRRDRIRNGCSGLGL